MSTVQHDHRPTGRKADSMSRPLQIALLMAVLVGGSYLLREHWNHVGNNWIYLLLLACPLMHLFHGRGGHGRHGSNATPHTKPAEKKKTL